MNFSEPEMAEMYIRGTEVNYYFVCKTKLWLFSHNVSMERESDLVRLGRLLHREFFKRDEKDVRVGPIAVDVLKKGNKLEIVEIKKSSSEEEADFYQTLYYLYYLRKLGIKASGKISYPKNKKIVKVELNGEKEREIEDILRRVREVAEGKMPSPEKKKKCRKCAYLEFCFS
jgi:CRISPR-associated exonuclease Cas4